MFRIRVKYFKFIIVLVIIAAFLSLFYFSSNSQTFSSIEVENTIYSIVIDAGSTGSRIHVFKLNHEDKNGNKNQCLLYPL